MSLLGPVRRRARPKRLLRALPMPARDILLKCLPAGVMERDFVLRHFGVGSVGAEIGVHEGDFSRRILDLARPQRLHLIDPWRYEEADGYAMSLYGGRLGVDQEHMDRRYAGVVRRFRREIDGGQVEIRRQRSLDACEGFPDGYFDWVYIDGNHLYEHVAGDLQLYRRKVKEGGWIAGDDYGAGDWWDGGVKKAVDEFVAQGEGDIVEIRHRQFILRKPG